MVSRGRGRSRGRPKGRGPLGDRRDGRERPPSIQECFTIRCTELLDRLQKRDTYSIFLEPVDPSEAPEYDKIIKHPMDLTTVRRRLNNGSYPSLDAFHDDLALIWSNCLLYNGLEPTNIYSKKAIELRKICDRAIPVARNNLEQDQRVIDRWTERHRRKPHPGASPQSSIGAMQIDSSVHFPSSSLGPSVGMSGSMLNAGGIVRSGSAARGANPNFGTSSGGGLQVTGLPGFTGSNASSMQSGAGNMSTPMLENAVNAIASLRREALREQYGTTGLFRPVPSASHEQHVFVSPDLPNFRPSSVRYNPFSKQADDLRLDSELLVPKRRLELSGVVYKALGSKPRLNPCRPMTSMNSLKVKDYVHSLKTFVDGAGVIASKIIDELLSPELAVLRAEDERQKSGRHVQPCEAAEKIATGPESPDTQRTLSTCHDRRSPLPPTSSDLNASQTVVKPASTCSDDSRVTLLPKISKRIDELDGHDGLERIVGADIANEVRAVPLSSINFAMPYGLNLFEMNEIYKLVSFGLSKELDLSFLSQLKQQTDQHVRRLGAHHIPQTQVSEPETKNSSSSPPQKHATSSPAQAHISSAMRRDNELGSGTVIPQAPMQATRNNHVGPGVLTDMISGNGGSGSSARKIGPFPSQGPTGRTCLWTDASSGMPGHVADNVRKGLEGMYDMQPAGQVLDGNARGPVCSNLTYSNLQPNSNLMHPAGRNIVKPSAMDSGQATNAGFPHAGTGQGVSIGFSANFAHQGPAASRAFGSAPMRMDERQSNLR